MRPPALAGALLLAAGALTGCAGAEDGALTVFAAASLTGPFTELAADFEAAHGVEVRLSFGGSADLVEQVQEGAPADVIATADTATMSGLVDDGLVAAPVPFATNVIAIAVPPGNPAEVTSFADLARPELRLVVCAEPMPCGAATARVADELGVTLSPVSEEQSVADVLGKVVTGEADAGVVYGTDIEAAGTKVDAVAVSLGPAAAEGTNTYPIAAVVRSGPAGRLAGEFVDFVAHDAAAREVLAAAGFGVA